MNRPRHIDPLPYAAFRLASPVDTLHVLPLSVGHAAGLRETCLFRRGDGRRGGRPAGRAVLRSRDTGQLLTGVGPARHRGTSLKRQHRPGQFEDERFAEGCGHEDMLLNETPSSLYTPPPPPPRNWESASYDRAVFERCRSSKPFSRPPQDVILHAVLKDAADQETKHILLRFLSDI